MTEGQVGPTLAFLGGYGSCAPSAPLAAEDNAYLLRSLSAVGRRTSESALLDTLRSLSAELFSASGPPAEKHADAARAYVCGIFASLAALSTDDNGEPIIRIRSAGASLEAALVEAAGSAPISNGSLPVYRGIAALDVAGRFFCETELGLPSQLRAFEEWCVRIAHIHPASAPRSQLKVQRVHPEARLPEKERVSDSGYDITLLYVKSTLGPTTLYGTGIIVEPPPGWYLDVVPRSSIIKRGYMLANNVGIIDRSYRGEILVPLLKVDPDAPALELPARVAQLIPRPIVHFPVVEHDSLGETHRGAGGFGSTGA